MISPYITNIFPYYNISAAVQNQSVQNFILKIVNNNKRSDNFYLYWCSTISAYASY